MSQPTNTAIPQPPRRWLTRWVLPLTVATAAVGALVWAGWHSLAPATEVRVVQVVMRDMEANTGATGGSEDSPANATAGAPARTAGSARSRGAAVQAPGWVEPAPFPIMVTALTPGVVRSVHALEGERVTAGQVLIELHNEEQKLALELSEAMLAEQQAKTRELSDELTRKRPLVQTGAVSAAEVARLELREQAMRASLRAAQAERDMRALALDRTQVRAPADGVVMARLASPGMVAGDMREGAPLMELYDPASLQVRADVPLSDAGLIAIGQPAEVQVDVLPNRVFAGRVVRVVHQADIAKNTLQAKVLLLEPAPELRPEMLARVRILVGETTAKMVPGTAGTATRARQSVWMPEQAIHREGDAVRAVVVASLRDGVGVADVRDLRLSGAAADGWVEVLDGLRAGDLLVTVDSGTPAPGQRVRVSDGPGMAHGAAAKGVLRGDH